MPDVAVGISCKPYRKSLSSHMQEIGRVMRPHPDAPKKLWLCHSGNIERFALDMFDIWEHGVGKLDTATTRDSTPRKRDERVRERVVCAECAGALRGATCMACGWERPARSRIHALEGQLLEFRRPEHLAPRNGLRADILGDPRKVWEGALAYAIAHTRKGEDHARRWAYGIWRGVYPGARLPFGWFEAPTPILPDPAAYALAERETKRFRKTLRRVS